MEACPVLINYPQILSSFQQGAHWLTQELEGVLEPLLPKEPPNLTKIQMHQYKAKMKASFLLVQTIPEPIMFILLQLIYMFSSQDLALLLKINTLPLEHIKRAGSVF